MPFVLPADPSDGQIAPASWGDDVRAALNFLANPPACHAYHSTSQSVANGTFTAITLNTESYDTDTMHDVAVNPTRITCKTAGLYIVTGWLLYGGAAAGERYTTINKNGVGLTPNQHDRRGGNGTGGGEGVNISAHVKLAVNDYLEIVGYQTTGGAVNVAASLAAAWVGLG